MGKQDEIKLSRGISRVHIKRIKPCGEYRRFDRFLRGKFRILIYTEGLNFSSNYEAAVRARDEIVKNFKNSVNMFRRIVKVRVVISSIG